MPRGHVLLDPKVRVHEAPDLSLYGCQSMTKLHEKVIELVERERRPLSVPEIDEMLLRFYGRKRIMSTLCYLAKIGRVARHEDGKRHRYGPKE